jgi:hypothetical protein
MIAITVLLHVFENYRKLIELRIFRLCYFFYQSKSLSALYFEQCENANRKWFIQD